MKTLVIVHGLAYGAERDFDALQLALALAKREREAARVFLLADAAACEGEADAAPKLL